MKAHLAKLSLALLSTVFLFGCQDMGSEPVGPEGLGPEFTHKNGEHGKGGGGGGGGTTADTLTLADGMQQATGFPVEVSKDTRKTLKVSNHDFKKPQIQMAFTDFFPGPDECVGVVGTNGGTGPVRGDGTFEKLLEQLTATADDAKVVMQIDKTALGSASGRHALIIQYDDEVLQNTYIMLGGWPGPVKVEEGPQDVFTFTGPVVVWDPNNGIKDERLISCPGAEVVVTLNR